MYKQTAFLVRKNEMSPGKKIKLLLDTNKSGGLLVDYLSMQIKVVGTSLDFLKCWICSIESTLSRD